MIIFCTNINCLQIVHMAVDLVSWAGSDPCAMVYTSQIVMSLPPRVHSTEATLLLCSLCSSQITFSGYIDAYIDYCYWIGHVYALHNLVLICIQVLAYTTLCSPLSSLSLSLCLITIIYSNTPFTWLRGSTGMLLYSYWQQTIKPNCLPSVLLS